MKPPPNAPVLSDFPDYVGEAFEKAFGPAGLQERPAAVKWIDSLQRLIRSTQQCSRNPAHHHVQGKPCPWCTMERASPGFFAFISAGSNVHVLPITIDTGQVMALIASIKDPGEVPDIHSVLIVPTNAVAQGQLSFNLTQLKTQHGLALGLSLLGVLIPQLGVPGLIAILFSGAGAAISLYPDKRVKAIVEARREAEQAWHKAQEAWSRQPGNTNYLEAKSEAMSFARDLNSLSDEEKRELQRLEDNKRKAQLERYLDRHPIKPARIRKIGSGRKAVLASFGIETAADVESHRVAAVQGFGPFLVSELVAWRRGIEKRFVFNANEPIDHAQIAAVKTALVNKKMALETRLRSTVARLQQVASFAVDQRNSLIASANAAFAKLNQARSDESATYPIFMRVAKIVSVSCLGIMLLNLASPLLANLPQVQPYARAPAALPPAAPRPPAGQQPSMNDAPFQAPSRSTAPPFQERSPNDPSNKQPEPLPDEPARDSDDASKEVSKSPRIPPLDNDPASPPSQESDDNPTPLPPPIPIPPRRPRISQPPTPPVATPRTNGEAWQANIQFRATGERLIWTSERGRAQYLRCR